jgi:hypothetical protein
MSVNIKRNLNTGMSKLETFWVGLEIDGLYGRLLIGKVWAPHLRAESVVSLVLPHLGVCSRIHSHGLRPAVSKTRASNMVASSNS